MFRSITVSVLVLLLQTSFYIKAGNYVLNSSDSFSRIKEIENFSSNVSDVLFVVKHCNSPNVVVYKANKTQKKDLDPIKPIDVFWLMNTKGKKTEALTFLEWKFAFGFKIQTLLKGKKYKITLNAIKGRDILIQQNSNGMVEGYMKINGILAKLKEVFIEFEESLLWPDVKYVDFKGLEIDKGNLISERIWNK